jgi:hypothetical protein
MGLCIADAADFRNKNPTGQGAHGGHLSRSRCRVCGGEVGRGGVGRTRQAVTSGCAAFTLLDPTVALLSFHSLVRKRAFAVRDRIPVGTANRDSPAHPSGFKLFVIVGWGLAVAAPAIGGGQLLADAALSTSPATAALPGLIALCVTSQVVYPITLANTDVQSYGGVEKWIDTLGPVTDWPHR